MFVPLLLLAFFSSLVLAQSQVASTANAQTQFNVTFNGLNITASDALNIPASPVATACASNINETQGLVSACGDVPACLCNAATVASFVNTETCMFFDLIATNAKQPSPLAGSNVLLGAYAAACAANKVVLPANQSALVLPPNWDGLHVSVLGTGATVVVVGIGAMMGFSALYILSNLS